MVGNKCAPGGDRLGETHQRNSERRRPEVLQQREIRHRERRKALRWPTPCTPWAPSPRNAKAAIPAPTAISGAGPRGSNRSIPSNIAIVDNPTAKVINDKFGRPSAIEMTLCRKGPFEKWMPSSQAKFNGTGAISSYIDSESIRIGCNKPIARVRTARSPSEA